MAGGIRTQENILISSKLGHCTSTVCVSRAWDITDARVAQKSNLEFNTYQISCTKIKPYRMYMTK